jgi:hypothetical protein
MFVFELTNVLMIEQIDLGGQEVLENMKDELVCNVCFGYVKSSGMKCHPHCEKIICLECHNKIKKY